MNPSDPTLVAQLRNGSRAAFEAVYAAEKARLFGFLVRLSRDSNVAADLFQNTWLKLARNARALNEGTDIRAWLFAVARNEYRSHCRAQSLDMSRLLVLDRKQDDLVGASPHEGPRAQAIEGALDALRDKEREVLLLVGVEGLEPQQAAVVLGISHAALRQRLARARRRLAELLDTGARGAVGSSARQEQP